MGEERREYTAGKEGKGGRKFMKAVKCTWQFSKYQYNVILLQLLTKH
jgi:hypothetical protein